MIKFVKKIFRIKEWSDWNRTVSYFNYIKNLSTRLFIDPFNAPKKTKDFNLVVKKYNLDDEKLEKESQSLRLLSYILFGLTLMIFFYGIYMLFVTNHMIGGVILCVSLVGFSLAFRYHFYYTAIKQKRLNLTIQEWMSYILKKD
ncbi:MAG: hypothetical protein EBQ95_01715 [Gammaproteobacteria bacterium]|nr:hypothetical protein [Gammaproteobacteria bacterium]